MGRVILFVFEVGSETPRGSSLVCNICKVRSLSLTSCNAKIYYVLAKDDMTRACVHFGTHNHPVKIGDYRKDIAKGRSLVKEQVHWTSMATNFDIV